jgi:hypothetical protein
MAKTEGNLLADFAMGGVAAAVSKTAAVSVTQSSRTPLLL